MTPGEKSLTSTGTRTYVSITPGFSVGRSSNWVIPRPSTPQRRQAWAGQDKSCVETVQLRRKKLKAQIKWGLLSGPHPTVTQILWDYWVGHIQPSPRYYGITEWATSNRHPDTMGLLSGPHPTVTQILWRLRGVSKEGIWVELFISTRYVSIVKQLFASKSKHTKGLKECSVLMEL